jgi:ribosomal protein L1
LHALSNGSFAQFDRSADIAVRLSPVDLQLLDDRLRDVIEHDCSRENGHITIMTVISLNDK